MQTEHSHAEQSNLTKNQALVFHALQGAEKPLGAYDLLDALRGDGLRSPLQIYRALDKLIGLGLVHRIESLNAFILCVHCDDEVRPDNAAFTICTKCGRVTELNDSGLARQLEQLAEDTGFALEKSTVELRGLCAACRAAA